MAFIICLILAYLLGSVSTGVLLSQYLGTPDPRTGGSKNPGATNVLRLSGKNQALAVLAGDILKGVIAVWIARMLGVHGLMLGFVAYAVVAGHIFPVFYKFKGGKGVAPMLGVLLGLSLWVGLFAIITWVVVAAVFRYSSLAGMVTAVFAPFYTLLTGTAAYFLPVLLITALVVWKHSENIQRLRSKTEDKIDFSQFMK